MFLLIFESLGTSELILIGIVALIFLGPRKLPQIARTIGKTMADFRNTTNEFKSTWQREVDFEEELKALKDLDSDEPEPASVPRAAIDSENMIAPPSIKSVEPDRFDIHVESKDKDIEQPLLIKEEEEEAPAEDLADKRTWL